MTALPLFLKKYFWEVDFDKLDLDKYRAYVAERLMEYGDEKTVRWLRRNFPAAEIKKVLRNSRGLSPRSANFWRLLAGIKTERVKCLQKPCTSIRKKFWRD